jgi:hypothetical protein
MFDHAESGAKGKLDPRWSEPYVLEKCLDHGTYVRRELDSTVLHRPVSGSNLKLYYRRPLSSSRLYEPAGSNLVPETVVRAPGPTVNSSIISTSVMHDVGNVLSENVELAMVAIETFGTPEGSRSGTFQKRKSLEGSGIRTF